jgi:hypothetical protein
MGLKHFESVPQLTQCSTQDLQVPARGSIAMQLLHGALHHVDEVFAAERGSGVVRGNWPMLFILTKRFGQNR